MLVYAPFWLENTLSKFQRILDDILMEHIGKIYFVYMDDIITFAEDKRKHYKRANVKVQLNKCEVLKEEVEFSSFVISNKGMKTNPKKAEAIWNFTKTQNN